MTDLRDSRKVQIQKKITSSYDVGSSLDRAPVVVITPERQKKVAIGVGVTFDATSSYSPDGKPLTFSLIVVSEEGDPTLTFDDGVLQFESMENGVYRYRIAVDDGDFIRYGDIEVEVGIDLDLIIGGTTLEAQPFVASYLEAPLSMSVEEEVSPSLAKPFEAPLSSSSSLSSHFSLGKIFDADLEVGMEPEVVGTSIGKTGSSDMTSSSDLEVSKTTLVDGPLIHVTGEVDDPFHQYNVNGGLVWTIGGDSRINKVSVTPDEDIFIINNELTDRRLSRLDKNGNEVWSWGAPTNSLLGDLAIDSQKNSYVGVKTSDDRYLYKIDENGNEVDTGEWPIFLGDTNEDNIVRLRTYDDEFLIGVSGGTGNSIMHKIMLDTGQEVVAGEWPIDRGGRVTDWAIDRGGDIYYIFDHDGAIHGTVGSWRAMDEDGNDFLIRNDLVIEVDGIQHNTKGSTIALYKDLIFIGGRDSSLWTGVAGFNKDDFSEVWLRRGIHGTNQMTSLEVDAAGRVYSGAWDGRIVKTSSGGSSEGSITVYDDAIAQNIAITPGLPGTFVNHWNTLWPL